MTTDHDKAAAAAIPDELYSIAAQAYRDLLTVWALENASEEVKADALQRAAISAGISDGDGKPWPTLNASALRN